MISVDLLRHYWNRSDLLEQLRQVTVIMADDGADRLSEFNPETVSRSRRLRDRLSPGDVQAMIDLYRSGATARQVGEKFGVSLRSVKRVLHQHGVRREGRSPKQSTSGPSDRISSTCQRIAITTM